MEQSYPPRSVLSVLRKFKVHFDVPDHPEWVSVQALAARADSVLRQYGLKDEKVGATDAVISFKISLVKILCHQDVTIRSAFLMTVNVLCPLGGYDKSELFCVWNNTIFDTMKPEVLAVAVEEAVARNLEALGRSIKGAEPQCLVRGG